MDLADDTVARLNELAELSGADLLVLFRDLVRSAASSSSSCVAVIITLNQEPPFYALDDRLRSGATTARSSLRAQITTAGPDQHVHSVIFLADAPGEYSHLASLFLDGFAGPTAKLDRLVIDQDLDAAAHLPEPDAPGTRFRPPIGCAPSIRPSAFCWNGASRRKRGTRNWCDEPGPTTATSTTRRSPC